MSAALAAIGPLSYSFSLTPKPTAREKAERFEKELSKLPQVECPVRHFFAPGLFAREMSIPAGAAITGAVHKTENLVVVSMGRLRILTESGSLEVKAGDTFTCRAGMKNAFVALEDARWTNFMANPTNETDIEKLVEMFTESRACELLGGAENKQLTANKTQELEA